MRRSTFDENLGTPKVEIIASETKIARNPMSCRKRSDSKVIEYQQDLNSQETLILKQSVCSSISGLSQFGLPPIGEMS